jgi:putative salt-induced outer membrane protein YdiY
MKQRTSYAKFIINILLISTVLLWGTSWAQVNTEAMRKTDLEEGTQGSASLSFGYQSGNTEVMTLKAGLRADHIQGNYHTFLIGNFKRGEKDQKLYTNKGFLHLRGIQARSRQLRLEAFAQWEYNEFILLQERKLLGGGIRWAPLQRNEGFHSNPDVNLYFGVGMMWEYEEIDLPGDVDTRLLRSTNYVSGNWAINDVMSCYMIGYYQVDTYNSCDYRILSDAGISFGITRALSFNMDMNFRYDHEPPGDVEKHDLEITNGVVLTF